MPGEPHEQYENSKRYDMEDEPPRSEGVHYATREVKWKSLSCVQLFAIHGLYSPWNYLGQNTGVDSLSLLQGISPLPLRDQTQVSCIAGRFFTSWATG